MSEVGVTGVSLNDLYLTKQQTNKNWKTEAVTGAWKRKVGYDEKKYSSKIQNVLRAETEHYNKC